VTGRPARRLAAARRAALAHRRWRWLALLAVSGGMWLSVVNVSIVNVALPDMAADFDSDVASMSWTVTGFLVTQAVLLSIAGRAGDLYGRRRIFVGGIVVLSIASLGGALASSVAALVVARVLMGVGASAMAPTAFAYAAELFAPEERGRALGFMSGVLGVAPVIALTLGGVLVEVAGWRSVFLFTPAIGVVVLAGAALVLPASAPDARHRSFDVPGAVLMATGLFLVLVALSRGDALGWTSAPVLGTALGGIAVLALFVFHETRATDPLLDLGLFHLRSFRTANVAAFLSAGALFGTLVLLPFYLTASVGLGAAALGVAIAPIALSFVVVAPLAGRAMSRVGSNRLIIVGFCVAAAGCTWTAAAGPTADYLLLLPGIVGLGVGLAMSSSAVTTTAIWGVPRDRLGVASALPNVSRYTGGALGAAAMGAILAAFLPGGLAASAAAADVGRGFRAAMLVAAGMLALGALVAVRMPRVVGPAALPSPPSAVAPPPVPR